MELEGTFQNGVIVPDPTESLQEGVRVIMMREEKPKKATFGERMANGWRNTV